MCFTFCLQKNEHNSQGQRVGNQNYLAMSEKSATGVPVYGKNKQTNVTSSKQVHHFMTHNWSGYCLLLKGFVGYHV